ncbi:MAG: sspK [Bacillus sp. (in: firmicutes)]|jgi:small acid-soluble spore protein K (minor)|uniref:small, acid-soluble spore protein K n=1 Tax=Bacillus sp. 1NLA3E TaxID=666686 RepID=UPI000247E96B|nr:small, acid-soluble spore protein K [Bacillus sp. 1NLA3E]AGK52445.1 acid-soluble spore protein K [Bacillus sp. 1NLA3E]MDF2904393.1 sspK [Bacillus sp. (in: firmicutes)]
MRNKVQGFPNQNNNKFEGKPQPSADYASKRADGTTNTQPQERMNASSHQESNTTDFLK